MQENPLIREKVYQTLRDRILALQGPELVRIPSERDLSEELGVSRVSLRAAVSLLAEQGLLVQLRGKGTYVTPRVALELVHVLRTPDLKPHDPFYQSFLVALTDALGKKNIRLNILDAAFPEAWEAGQQVILAGQGEDALIDALMHRGCQVFAIQRHAHRQDMPQVSFDDYAIGSRAASLMADNGCRLAGLLAGPERYASASQRRQGFLDTAARKGMEVRVISGKMNWEGGVQAARSLLEGELPESLFAVNDWMAAGCMQTLSLSGFHVPEDLTVMGCDDLPLASELSPALTTFRWDMTLLSEELLSVMEESRGGQASRTHRMLQAELVRRESF